jgi:hypothetical protein
MKYIMYLYFTIPLFIVKFNLYFNFVFINIILKFQILLNHSIPNQSGIHRDDKAQIPNLDFCISFLKSI